ncbi:MAG: hypothetical protein HY075_04790 [Deltaproteobacteria bacterium]|nr:hypothetical protein [Deltaproteobacteria bacterium]
MITLGSAFLHQCGHGVGARIEGMRISTGFASAGAPQRRPSDADYRDPMPVEGTLTLHGILGPGVNWLLGIVAVVLLHRARRPTLGALALAAAAIANAGIRLFPISKTLVTIFTGRLFLDDEATWGIAGSGDLRFPITVARLNEQIARDAGVFTHHAWTFFWPAVSLAISLTVMVAAYPKALALFAPRLPTRLERVLFALMPFLVTPAILVAAGWLDEHVRLNW